MISEFLLNSIIFFYFLVANFVLFYLPGRMILRFMKIRFKFFEQLFISLVLGLVFFSFVIYILGFLGLSFFIYLIVPLIGIVDLIKGSKPALSKNFNLLFKNFWLWFLLIVGTISQNLALFRSGIIRKNGDLFFITDWAWHDFSWHLALIEELKKQVPPLNPIFKAEILKDYHYFYDLLVAGFGKITNISSIILIYRFFPILISLFLGLSVYLFVKKLSNKTIANISLFLTYFCGSFAYFIPLLKDKNQQWGESSFWVSQTFSMAIQPHFLLSVVIIFTSLIIFFSWLKQKDLKISVIIALLLGSIVGFKSYGFLVVLGGMMAVELYELFFKTNKKIILLGLLTCIITLLIYLPNSGGKNMFFYAPFWFPKAMVASPGRLYLIDLILKEEHYLQAGNYLRFIQVKVHQLMLFVIGNLGLRSIGFLGIYFFFLNQKKNVNKKSKVMGIFLMGSILSSFIFPLLFLQKGVVWNSIQTWYFLLIFMNIFTAIFIFEILKKIKSNLLKLILLSLFLFFSIPTTIKTFIDLNIKIDPILITKNEMDGMKELKNLTNSQSLILLYPSFKNRHSSLVSAISQRRVYYAQDAQANLFGVDFESEVKKIEQIFSSTDKSLIQSFVKENKIDYVFLWSDEYTSISKVFKESIDLIYDNEAASIYYFKT